MKKCKWTNLLKCPVENPNNEYCFCCLSTQVYNISFTLSKLIDTLVERYSKLLGNQIITELQKEKDQIIHKCKFTSILSCPYYEKEGKYPDNLETCLICISKNALEKVYKLDKDFRESLTRMGILVKKEVKK